MPYRFKCFDDVFSRDTAESCHMVVVRPEEKLVFDALLRGFNDGFISGASLIGDSGRIQTLAREVHLDEKKLDVFHTTDDAEAVRQGIEIEKTSAGNLLFPGQMTSQDFLLHYGNALGDLKILDRLSHIVLFEVPGFDRLIVVTDPTVHVAPRLAEKVTILKNVVGFCHKLGWNKPLIALIAAIEKIDYLHMPHTVDSAALVKMVQIGQIKGAVVDGPLALDNAVSEEAAAIKGIRSPVAGTANVLMMPAAEAGILLCKILVYFARACSASVVVGGGTPIVFPSRSDDVATKYNSMRLAFELACVKR